VVVEFATDKFRIVDDAVSTKSGPEKYARPVVVALVVVEFVRERLKIVEDALFTKSPFAPT